MKTRSFRTLLVGLMLICLFATNPMASLAAAVPDESGIQPRYTGIHEFSVDLDISASGYASCYGAVAPLSGYSVDLTMELQQDGTTIKSWIGSGSVDVVLERGRYVESGHIYQVVLTANIKNSKGVIVSSPTLRSDMKAYF